MTRARGLVELRPESRSGQVVVEYILVVAMIVGVIFGVMRGVIQPKLDKMQNDIAAASTHVVAQQPLGIPIEWFFPSNPISDDEIKNRLAGLGKGIGNPNGGGGGNSPGANSSGSNPDGGGGANDPLSGPGRRGNRRNGSGDNPNASTPEGGKETEDAAKRAAAAKGGGGDGGGTGGGGRVNGETAAGEGSRAGEKDKKASGEMIAKGRLSVRGDDIEDRGGCGNFNLFTLLKIVAILAILLLVAAVFVTGKGQKGD
jgi:hypothetical protein